MKVAAMTLLIVSYIALCWLWTLGSCSPSKITLGKRVFWNTFLSLFLLKESKHFTWYWFTVVTTNSFNWSERSSKVTLSMFSFSLFLNDVPQGVTKNVLVQKLVSPTNNLRAPRGSAGAEVLDLLSHKRTSFMNWVWGMRVNLTWNWQGRSIKVSYRTYRLLLDSSEMYGLEKPLK